MSAAFVIRQIFNEFDKDGNGTLDKAELQQMAWRLGQSFDEDQTAEIYKLLDKNSDGHIDLKEASLCRLELIAWWESPERTEGSTDGRLAAAIAMREAKRKYEQAVSAIRYANKKGHLAGMAANRTCHWNANISVGDFEDEATNVRCRVTKTTPADAGAFAKALGGEGMDCALVLEFSLLDGKQAESFVRIVSDIDSKIDSVMAKVEGVNPIPWWGGVKAVVQPNPKGETVLQVAIFSKQDMVEEVTKATDGVIDLSAIVKQISIDLGLAYNLEQILGMKGVEMEDPEARKAAVAKIHAKAKAIANIPGHPQARDCKPCLTMSHEEFDTNVCQAGGMPLGQVAAMLGMNILPEGVVSVGDLLQIKLNVALDVQQKLFAALKVMQAPAFLVEFGSALVQGDLNLDFGNAANFLRKFQGMFQNEMADFISANLDEPVAVMVAEATAFVESACESLVETHNQGILHGDYYHQRVMVSYFGALIEAGKAELIGLVGVRAFGKDLRLDLDLKGLDLFDLARQFVPELDFKPTGKLAQIHEIFDVLDKNKDKVLDLEELLPLVKALPKVVSKDRMPWLASAQSDSEAVHNLLLAADPAVLVEHPVPMLMEGITREHFVAMWGPQTPSGAGPVDFLGLEFAVEDDGLDRLLDGLQ